MGRLQKLFGPSREDIWRQLSAEMEGRFLAGGFFKGDKVQVAHGGWTLTLDHHVVSTGNAVVEYTRMRAPYFNSDGFHFTIYRRGLFTELAKRLGMQDVEIGDAALDHDFVIKTNDEAKLRELLADATLRELIARQPRLDLTVKDDEGWFGPEFPRGVDELYFMVPGVIKDVERLKQLYDLFARTLDQLCRIGAARKEPPGLVM